MIERLSPRSFAAFLADVWKRRGWKTSLRDRDGGAFAVVGRRGDGKRGMLYVLPDTDREVDTERVQTFVEACKRDGVDHAVLATRGAFTSQARSAAADAGVYLVDPDVLRTTVAEGGYEAVLRRHAEADGVVDDGDDGDGGDGGDPSLPIPESVPGRDSILGAAALVRSRLLAELPIAERIGPVADRVATGPALDRRAIALIAALCVLLFGSGLALGGVVAGGGAADDAPAVTAVSTGGEDATLQANWSASVTDAVRLANGSVYESRPDQTFVVVRMNVTNVGEAPASLSQGDVVLEADGRRYGHQPLSGVHEFGGGLFPPAETKSAWTAFAVPEGTTTGTVLIREDDSSPSIRFVRDPNLEISPVGA